MLGRRSGGRRERNEGMYSRICGVNTRYCLYTFGAHVLLFLDLLLCVSSGVSFSMSLKYSLVQCKI